MADKDTVIELPVPDLSIKDTLTELARQGAQEMLAVAMKQEVTDFVNQHKNELLDNGQSRFVRNGSLPERAIQTGIGAVSIKQPRVRDRSVLDDGLGFNSKIIPPYLRRSKSMNELLPLLYLRGISTGDFQSALSPIFGDNAKNLSSNVISSLKSKWEQAYQSWQKRDLSLKRYVYWWADGIYLSARMEDAKSCVLVIIGVDDKGKKAILAIEDGLRESKVSWQNLLRNLKSRGLSVSPKVATGDGAMGFWGALSEEFSDTKHQRCWVHKTVNVLDKLPKSQQAKATSAIHEIWMAATKAEALQAFEEFNNQFSLKYPKATKCLNKDKDELLTFYDFPAEHWKPLRTTNPIESTFATVRHRTKRSKGCFSRKTILTMVFKLCQSAEQRWIRLNGFNRLADVIRGVKFQDGVAANNNITKHHTEVA